MLVADAAGEELLAATFAHDEKGLRALCRQLVRLKVELVAIERPDGLLVERLLDAGLRVLALHPNQVARAPDRDRDSRASRPSPLPGVGARRRSDQGAAGADPRAGGPRRHAHRVEQPATSRDALAGDAGQAAIAIESGKRKTAAFRWACNKRLRDAFDTLADSTRHWHPWAQDLYAAARARGHDHPRAIRTLGRAWSRVVWQCWQQRTPYDPTRHRALQQHVLVTVPTPSGPRPDLAATQRMLGAAVTRGATQRAERGALDRKPTSANALGG